MTTGGPVSARRNTGEDLRALVAVDAAAARGAAGVATLVDMLASPSWSVRRRVIATLAALGTPAVAPLCAVLTDDRSDETANAAAMDALSASAGEVGPLLIELASHPDPAVAADAARVLGRRRERAASSELGRLAVGADDNVAVAAIEALGSIGGRGAVETLIALVRAGNFFRTFPAIDVLGRSGDPRAVTPLVGLLGDARYAMEAARALGHTAERGAAAPLVALLGQPSPTMARIVAVALDDLARGHQDKYGEGALIHQVIASAAPSGAVRALAGALHGANEGEQIAIVRVLGLLRDPASMTVLDGLVDGSPELAKAAAFAFQALGSLADDRLRDFLRHGDSARRAIVLPLVTRRMAPAEDIVACFDDPEGGVRALAAEALARVGGADRTAALFPLLQDPNARVVQAASAAIQALGSDVTQTLTLDAARSPDPRVRREAMNIIRAFGWGEALPFVVAAVSDPDQRLREAAIMALPVVDHPDARGILFAQARAEAPRDRATAMRALGHGDRSGEAVAILVEATRDADAWVRYYAAQALGRLGVEAVVDDLHRLLDDTAGQVRVAAVEALSRLRADEAFAALKRASLFDDPDLRRAAVLGLGLTRRSEAVPLLLVALRSPDPATRLVATSALGSFASPEVTAALADAARDDDETVRQTAIALLAESPGEDATLALVSLLAQSPDVARVRMALSAASPGRVAGIAQALETADDDDAAVLVSSLARMRTLDADEALASALTAGSVVARRAAAVALGSSPRPGSLAALEAAAASDPDAEVRRIAAAAARG